MKVFLSYPHQDEVPGIDFHICEKIYNTLTERYGTENVWRDKERLHPADDWRRKVTSGIEQNDVVVSCMNSHAVGEGGVCLDELGIAVSLKGGNIKGILLEPAEIVKPRAALGHRQWIDMCEWPEIWKAGSEIFEAWFAEKAKAIFRMIESDESKTFNEEIDYIKSILTMADYSAKKKELLERRFTGRKWLSDKIRQWMQDDRGGKLFAVYGSPGSGKSTFAMHYSFHNPDVAAILCFEHGRDNYNSASAMIQAIAYQFSIRLPDYRRNLIRQLQKGINGLRDSELFDQLLIKPLTDMQINGGMEQLLIILDGVDECSDTDSNIVATVLRDCVNKLPSWIRVIVTSRPDEAVLMRITPSVELNISNDENNLPDLLEYIQAEIQEEIQEEDQREIVTRALLEHSEGSFLYVYLAVESIRKGYMDPLNVDSYPHGLYNEVFKWMERVFPCTNEYREKFRLPVGAILASPIPFPVREMGNLLGMSENEISDFARRLQVFLKKTIFFMPDGEAVEFEHKYVRDFFCDKSNRFYSSPQDAVRVLAEGCLDRMNHDCTPLTSYEQRYFLDFLRDAGMKAQYNAALGNKGLGLSMLSQSFRKMMHSDELPLFEKLFININLIFDHLLSDSTEAEDIALTCYCRLKLIRLREDLGNTSDAEEILNYCLDRLETNKAGFEEFNYYLLYMDIQRERIHLMSCSSEEDWNNVCTGWQNRLESDKRNARLQASSAGWYQLMADYVIYAEIMIRSGRPLNAEFLYAEALDANEEALCYSNTPDIETIHPEAGFLNDYIKALSSRIVLFGDKLTTVEEYVAAENDMFATRLQYLRYISISSGMVVYDTIKSVLEKYWNQVRISTEETEPPEPEEAGTIEIHLRDKTAAEWVMYDHINVSALLENIENLHIHEANQTNDSALSCASLRRSIRMAQEAGHSPRDTEYASAQCERMAKIMESENETDLAIKLYSCSLILNLNETAAHDLFHLRAVTSCCENIVDLLSGYDNPYELRLRQHMIQFLEEICRLTGEKEDYWLLAEARHYYGGCLKKLEKYPEATEQFKMAYDASTILMDYVPEARKNHQTFYRAYEKCRALCCLFLNEEGSNPP